ncbi:LysM peptidoglycan-binding domain-containing protein [Kineococcus sp. SYSU DK018]|uniref:LysM peptidoglycan-binding domain-containing protein n=1 Tax=Kineococcus sp. SYSU DK018 TaxID=3383139 RepID=UPI003D7DBADA
MATSTLPGPRPAPARLPRCALSARARRLELLRAAAAAAVLLAVLVGVPAALVALVGNPLPATGPARSWLDAELTASAVVDVLAVVLWLAWAHFALCVLAELTAWARGGGGRPRLGGANRLLAQRLVATALLLTAGAAWVPPASAATAPGTVALTPATGGATGTGSTAGPTGVPTATGEAGAARAADPVAGTAPGLAAGWVPTPPPAAAEPTTVAAAGAPLTHVVQPPAGRHHDCLWDIAERTLGDPLRYREIFELNADRLQPDGARLVDADLVRPGWVLLLPADAVGAVPAPRTAHPAGDPAGGVVAGPAADPAWTPAAGADGAAPGHR